MKCDMLRLSKEPHIMPTVSCYIRNRSLPPIHMSLFISMGSGILKVFGACYSKFGTALLFHIIRDVYMQYIKATEKKSQNPTMELDMLRVKTLTKRIKQNIY